ncbi:VOC family protein [Phormidium sp. FACHB-1136]|uniref:VOC family protein n=1 Tax=Phormidium sp. FACHB-1136 TaxID=2692848 RepID=UPI001688BBF0|nr:VOC family protein [Phormidium sp. FACHB-1136]MBD2429470.1 VOC family protein [Phormidium sp. FACHB-1136]
MITGIRHIGLVVSDLDKALNFWCDVLGFQIQRKMEESGPHLDAMMGLENVQVTTAKLSDQNGNLLELLHFKSHPDKPIWGGTPYSTGLTHIALTVQNLDQTVQKLNQAGVTFPGEIQKSPDGTVKVIYSKGPEGILLELVEVVDTMNSSRNDKEGYIDVVYDEFKKPFTSYPQKLTSYLVRRFDILDSGKFCIR